VSQKLRAQAGSGTTTTLPGSGPSPAGSPASGSLHRQGEARSRKRTRNHLCSSPWSIKDRRGGSTYEEAVTLAAGHARAGGRLLVQDVAWPGYEQVPAWIIAGYATMFTEIEAQLGACGAAPADLVAVPAGVGSLAQAAVMHFRRPGIACPPALMTAEPNSAACVLHSLARDQLTRSAHQPPSWLA
jgi:hypothetical protein